MRLRPPLLIKLKWVATFAERSRTMKLIGKRTITDKAVKEIVAKIESKEISKGAGIRELFAGGLAVKEIAEVTGIRYNHVYNVVKNEVLIKGLQDEIEKTGRSSENSKKNQIIAMLEEGKTITEISQELKCLYNYVWQIAKANGYTKKQLAAVNAEVEA
jgi:predicted transcriptional regulator